MVNHVTFERDTEPYSKSRDAKVTKYLKEVNVSVSSHWGHTLWDVDWLRSRHSPPASSTGGAAQFLGIPLTYQGFIGLVNRVVPEGPAKPLPEFDTYIGGTSLLPPDLAKLEKDVFPELGCSLGPQIIIDELELDSKAFSNIGAALPDTIAAKQDLLFPGGELEALSRLKRTVSFRFHGPVSSNAPSG